MYNSLIGFLGSSGATRVEATIQGVQSGTLALGDYTVDGDIVVLEGSELILTAGSTFKMENNVLWEIQGTLTAIGTASEHIDFDVVDGGTSWAGIRFCKEVTDNTATITANTSTDIISGSITLTTDRPIRFTTTGTLPAPLEVGARYYIRSDDSLSQRLDGPKIDITDTGSGTHTAITLSPSSAGSGALRSADYLETQTLQYCDISNCDKTVFTDRAAYQGPIAYRHWVRGSGLMVYELGDMVFDHLTFTNCHVYETGGGAYIQPVSGTSADFSYWSFDNCSCEQYIGAAYKQSHGSTFNLDNFSFNNSDYPAVNGYPFIASSSTDRITVADAGLSIQDDWAIRELASSGSLPGGLSGGTTYFVQNVVPDSPSAGYTTFQVSLTPGGSIVNITSAGSGSHTGTFFEDYEWFSVSTMNLTNITIT